MSLRPGPGKGPAENEGTPGKGQKWYPNSKFFHTGHNAKIGQSMLQGIVRLISVFKLFCIVCDPLRGDG